jgi:hypothetical protein
MENNCKISLRYGTFWFLNLVAQSHFGFTGLLEQLHYGQEGACIILRTGAYKQPGSSASQYFQ